jgi:hypothetical protein
MNEIIYKGFRKDELEYQYNPRESVPEYPQLSKRKAEQARKVRETVKSWLNVSYGSSARETLASMPQTRRADRCSSISPAATGARALRKTAAILCRRSRSVERRRYWWNMTSVQTSPSQALYGRPARQSRGFSRTSRVMAAIRRTYMCRVIRLAAI